MGVVDARGRLEFLRRGVIRHSDCSVLTLLLMRAFVVKGDLTLIADSFALHLKLPPKPILAMEKVAILTASKVDPSVSINYRPRHDINRFLSPTLEVALQFQKLVSFTVLFVYLWSCHISRFTLAIMRYTSKLTASHGFLALKFGIVYGSSVSGRAVVYGWNSKSVQKLRNKLWMEFAIWIMGSGNTVMLLIFWPGWWLLAGCWTLWTLLG